MEFDRSYNGAADWSFPSPSATPTTSSFSQNIFHTPKSTAFPSHFNDAFSTPHMPAYATPHQHDFAHMTPLQRYHAFARTAQDAQQDARWTTGTKQSGPNPALAQYQDQLTSPLQQTKSPYPAIRPRPALSFDSAQIRTPPPTRDTSARKAANAQPIAFGTPSTIASRRFASPQQGAHVPHQQQNPTLFPSLHFSPSLYQFDNFGPASAPVLPQNQLLWASDSNLAMYSPQDALDDPFAPSASQSMQWPADQYIMSQTASFDTPAMSSFSIQAPVNRRPATAISKPSVRPGLTPSGMTSAGVNPSLVYSSPIAPILTAVTQQDHACLAPPNLEPRRNESEPVGHGRSGTISSADSLFATSRPILRRSNTTTGTRRPQSAHLSTGAGGDLARSSNLSQPPRTTSPLKRVGKLPMGSISESRKTSLRRSVILTVDETGRARTETLQQEDSPTIRSMRDRYPGLFDSDTSDEESEEEECKPSSFNFSTREERRLKAARLDPPVENLEGLTIPRSSSSASTRVTPSRAAIAAAAQLRRTGSLRRRTPSRNGSRRSEITANASFDTASMEILDRRQLGTSAEKDSSSENTLEAHNHRWSMMSLEQQSVSPPNRNQDHNQYAPSAMRSIGPQVRLVRCTCGINEDQGQDLVQCSSCTQSLHASCAGLDPRALPLQFICFLCAKPGAGLSVDKVGARSRS